MSSLMRIITTLCCVTLLSACSGNVKENLGLKKQAPDEFKVVSNQPLSIPPDFRLPEPVPGASRPQQVDLDKQAEALLFGKGEEVVLTSTTGVEVSSLTSTGETALLSQAGVEKADPRIRQILTEEEQILRVEKEESGFFSQLFTKNKVGDPELNATAEKDRIAGAQKSGETITGDDTKVVEKRDRGLLGKLLNWD
jgi:hypothetical protein